MGLSQNGYYAMNLQKNPLDENVIPLEYYDDSNESLNDILYTVYIAYEPDIILLNQEEEIFESSKASDIDMYIVRKNNMYELYAEDRIGIVQMIKLALIDNGIPYHMRNNRNQRIVHKSFLASKCDPSEYKDDKSFHGAVCVGIITSICSDIELWDLVRTVITQ